MAILKSKTYLALIALLAFPSTGLGQVSSKYPYLVNATNAMSATVGQSAAPNREALLGVTAQACQALSKLLDDKTFLKDLSRLDEQIPKTRKERAQLKRELDLFMLSFLRIEERWLLDAGLEERVAKEILWAASLFRNSIDAEVKSGDVLKIISYLRKEVCGGSQILQEAVDNSEGWAIVRKWSFRIGGVTLIAVDVGAAVTAAVTAPATIAIIAPVAAGSSAIGASIAGWGEEPR